MKFISLTSSKRGLSSKPKRLLPALLIPLLLAGSAVSAQTDSARVNSLNEVVVKSIRATEKTGMSFTNVGKKELRKQNLGQDIPFLLNQLPSVVSTSDAGTGVGYTGIRIRGTDPTRINVTVNGIPFNDSESQGVFWVNMPDFSSSVQSIQVQRGVGTSTNGAGAFGASINVNTLSYEKDPYAETNVSVGSFNTIKTNVLASTGLMNDHFVIDTRLSRIASDGFIDRSGSNLRSFFLSGGYYAKDNFIRLNVFSGKEITKQAWEGVPESAAKGDLKGINDYVSRNYLDDAYKNELISRGRKFNPYTYDNQVDNYQQDHYQLISSFKLNQYWRFNPTLHYTYGRGFYEQYRPNDKFSSYGLPNITIGNTEIKRSDLIRRKWLDNHFYGGVWSFDYEGPSKINATIGGGWNRYEGKHFGEVIWARYNPSSDTKYKWYNNKGTKNDFNIYTKAFYQFNPKLNAYVDLQYRAVNLSILGIADKLQSVDYSKTFNFFNPKLGLNYAMSQTSSAYLSYAVGNKEPGRQDFVDNAPAVPKHETLQDLELGYRVNTGTFKAEANVYYMNYKDQLVLTGKVNNVGEAIRMNVADSYRAGLELQASARLSPMWVIGANATFSRNKIRDFTETIPSETEGKTIINQYSNSDISFSPNLIAGGQLSFMPHRRFEITLLSKYVSKQFLDNTASESKKIDAFFVNDLRLVFTPAPKLLKELQISLLVNNIFNHQYESNGYTYSYEYEGVVTENFLFPQARINFLSAVRLRF